MTLTEFAQHTTHRPPEYDHKGAYVWAELERLRPDLANQIRGTDRDCSQWTMNLVNLWPWLKEHWDET